MSNLPLACTRSFFSTVLCGSTGGAVDKSSTDSGSFAVLAVSVLLWVLSVFFSPQKPTLLNSNLIKTSGRPLSDCSPRE